MTQVLPLAKHVMLSAPFAPQPQMETVRLALMTVLSLVECALVTLDSSLILPHALLVTPYVLSVQQQEVPIVPLVLQVLYSLMAQVSALHLVLLVAINLLGFATCVIQPVQLALLIFLMIVPLVRQPPTTGSVVLRRILFIVFLPVQLRRLSLVQLVQVFLVDVRLCNEL